MRRRFFCWICKKQLHGLMAFASHVAQEHKISAFQYWNKYGHGNKKVEKKEDDREKVEFT